MEPICRCMAEEVGQALECTVHAQIRYGMQLVNPFLRFEMLFDSPQSTTRGIK